MKLYIGNATKQIFNFLYRVPEATGVRSQEIQIGAQVQVSGELSMEAVEMIIDQHIRYGLVDASKIDQAREFSGLCYSVDKPINIRSIEKLMEHNTDELIKLGKKIRQEAAISGNNALENELNESDRPEKLRNFEMSIVEENHDDRDEMPAIAEGFRVVPDEGEQRQGRGRRRR
jgi:hypothetical protein